MGDQGRGEREVLPGGRRPGDRLPLAPGPRAPGLVVVRLLVVWVHVAPQNAIAVAAAGGAQPAEGALRGPDAGEAPVDVGRQGPRRRVLAAEPVEAPNPLIATGEGKHRWVGGKGNTKSFEWAQGERVAKHRLP